MREEWTEKYRPRSLDQVVGNDDGVRAAKRWAESWRTGAPRKKALVLRGEPGTGKTSTALAIAHDMDWDYIEMNASDSRNAASIRAVAGLGAVNQTFSSTGEFLSAAKGRMKLVIIDEADNFFGKLDYGGAKAIVEVIKEAGQPIILIVNDYRELTRKSPAIKSLADVATFRRLGRGDMLKVLKEILRMEGVDAAAEVLHAIVENAGGDLRAAINDLQMMVEGRKTISSADTEPLGKRNQETEVRQALASMFRADSVRAARDATLQLDEAPDDLILWIEENIPSEMRTLEELSTAFDFVSRSDIYLARTKRLQHYGLWSYAKDLMTGGVVLSRRARAAARAAEYKYPGQFIMLRRAKELKTVRNAVARRLAEHMHTSSRCMLESNLELISRATRNDSELMIQLARKLDLGEAEVAFMLGESPYSPKVTGVLAAAKSEEDTARDRSRGSQSASRAGGFSLKF
ncbi:MAG: replication factor C large subunit [Thermoplasmata archaeon]